MNAQTSQPLQTLKLETQYASIARVGDTHGLDLEAIYRQYSPVIHQAVTTLYGEQDLPGAWKRWLALSNQPETVQSIQTYANTVLNEGYTDLVVLGIGGSSLGGYALLKALCHPYWNQLPQAKRGKYLRFHFLENVDADQVAGLKDVLDPKTTLFNVITKSGTTAETMSAFLWVRDYLEQTVGPEAPKRQIVFTTDREKGILRQLANQAGNTAFEVPDDVGGRFSIFSAVGLLPAALCGVDIAALLSGIQAIEPLLNNPDIFQNPAAQAALIHYVYYLQGKPISVFMPYSSRLASVSDWYVQLWAESLGKKQDRDGRIVHVGPTPVRAVGVTDQHSQVQLFNEGPFDKVITFVEVETADKTVPIPTGQPVIEPLAYLSGKTFNQLMQAEFFATRHSLAKNNRPSLTLTLPNINEAYFAQLLYFLEVQTSLTGALLNIDPFDQPGVELAKNYTYALMGHPSYEKLLAELSGLPQTVSV